MDDSAVTLSIKDDKALQYAMLLLTALELTLKHDLNFRGDNSLNGRQRAAVELVLWAIGEPPTPLDLG